MSTQSYSQQTALAQPAISVFTQTLAAFALGALIVLAVGLLPVDAVHNAAHDTRHSFAFPCH